MLLPPPVLGAQHSSCENPCHFPLVSARPACWKVEPKVKHYLARPPTEPAGAQLGTGKTTELNGWLTLCHLLRNPAGLWSQVRGDRVRPWAQLHLCKPTLARLRWVYTNVNKSLWPVRSSETRVALSFLAFFHARVQVKILICELSWRKGPLVS